MLVNYARLVSKKDPEGAGKLYKKAAKHNPKCPRALTDYANFLRSDVSKKFLLAEKFYLKAIDLDPKYIHSLYYYGLFLLEHKNDKMGAIKVIDLLKLEY